MVSAHRRRTTASTRSPSGDAPSRADALRRFAAEVSGRQDLDGLFRDVIDESFTLFGVDEAGLWTYDGSPTPLHLAAQRGLSPEVLEIIGTLPRDAPTLGMDAMRADEVRIMRGDLQQTLPAIRRIYRRAGIRTICYVPIVFHNEPLGLLVLYHHSRYAWTDDETALARAFADHLATAISNARLANSTRTLAARLRVISDLAARLSHLQDVPEHRPGDRRRDAATDRLRHDPGLPGRPQRGDGANRSPSRASSGPTPTRTPAITGSRSARA